MHRDAQLFAQRLSEHLSPRTSAYHEIWLDKKVVRGKYVLMGLFNRVQQVAGKATHDIEPLYGETYLPRKFKVVFFGPIHVLKSHLQIAIAIPPHNDVDVLAHCLGFIAIPNLDGSLAGFNITIGGKGCAVAALSDGSLGGMGMTHGNKATYPRLGDVLAFCTVEQGRDVAEKVMLIQRDNGDRENRKHARLKYTLEDMGQARFVAELEQRLGFKLQPPRPFTFTSNNDRFGWAESRRSERFLIVVLITFIAVDNKWCFGVFIENGRVLGKIRSVLRDIAKMNVCDFRLTANQNVCTWHSTRFSV